MKALAVVSFIALLAQCGRSQEVFIDFETFPDGTEVPIRSASLSNQWSSFGLIISDSTPEDGASAYTGVAGLPAHSGERAISNSEDPPGGFLTFSFVVPGTTSPGLVTEVGLWVQNNDTAGSTVTFFGTDNSILQTVYTATNHMLEMFVSYSDSRGIAAIRIDDPDYFVVDDLQFGPVSAVPVSTARIRGGNIVVCWPTAFSNFTVQVAHHINRRHPERTKWNNVNVIPAPNGDSYCLTNRVSEGRFFRLTQP